MEQSTSSFGSGSGAHVGELVLLASGTVTLKASGVSSIYNIREVDVMIM